MKYQALFHQKNNEKMFKNVVCCSRDWVNFGVPTAPVIKIKKKKIKNRNQSHFFTDAYSQVCNTHIFI